MPVAGAVPLPRSIPLWQAALLGCGVVTGIGAVNRGAPAGRRQRMRDRLRRRRPAGDRRCAAGGGGHDHRRSTCEQAKLELALRRGATHAVNAAEPDVVEQVHGADRRGRRPRVRGRRAAPATIRQAWDVLRAGRDRDRGRRLAREASRCRCPRSSSSPRRRSPAATTARPTSTPRSPSSCSWSSTAGSISPRSCPDLIGLDDVEAALERLRRGQGARSVIVIDEQLAGARAMSPRRPRRPRRRGVGRRRRAPTAATSTSCWPGAGRRRPRRSSGR